ncbi:MAG: hypothetical protein R3F11_17625 [Verrucomicrobiales bacterium]
MRNAIDKVQARLERATFALEKAGIPYAVIGGNAVAAWVSRIDESVVRNTKDVDFLLRRSDLPSAKQALEEAGFLHRTVSVLGGGAIDLFLDGPGAQARDALHIIFAGEKIAESNLEPAPDVDEIDQRVDGFRLIDLDALVRMKLTSFRRKDQVHLLDMISIGQIDEAWLDRVPPSLRGRLQELLDDPEG